VGKNLSPAVTSLVDAATLLAIFVQIDSTRCGLEKLEVFDSISGTAVTSGTLYTVLALASRSDLMSGINIDTTVPLTDGTVIDVPYSFAIKATASGGFSHWKAFNSKIIVCGIETLSPDQATYSHSLDIGPSATTFTVDVASWFSSNDPHCPPKAYHLRIDNTALASATLPSAADLLNFYLTGTTLSLYP